MGIKEYIEHNEKTYHDKRDIKYLFCEGKNSNKLIVTFPALQSEGKPPIYNYIGTLMESCENKLYLLDDFGDRGSYLIAENRDNSIEKSVLSLILYICKNYNIKLENVILQGSSKGGYSTLYFGIKYGFGYVIAGAPQTYLGDFLRLDAPKVADYIAGGHEEEDINYLNNLLFDLIKNPLTKLPQIFIHVGSGDHHYKRHVKPFINELDNNGIKYHLDVKNYFYHPSTVIYYPDYLIKTLKYLNNERYMPIIDNVSIEQVNNLLRLTCKVEGEHLQYACYILLRLTCKVEGEHLQYACYIYSKNNCIKKIMYQNQNLFEYEIDSNGIYCARLYVRNYKENLINFQLTDEIKITEIPEDDNQTPNKPGRDLKNHLDKLNPSDIDIHGSAISKLIFDYDYDNEVILGKYIAKQSFCSVISVPFPDEYDIKLSSPWEKSMVKMDLYKEFFNKLSNNKAKYLLIDLLDERMSLVKYKDTIFTFSDIHGHSKILDNFKVEYINKFDLEENSWKDWMDQYVNGLLEKYTGDKIIIHEVYLNDTYKTINGDIKSFPDHNIEYNKKVNVLLKQYYTYLKYRLPILKS